MTDNQTIHSYTIGEYYFARAMAVVGGVIIGWILRGLIHV